MTVRKPLPSFLELHSFLLAHESRLQQDTSGSPSAQAMIVSNSQGRGSYSNRSLRGNFQRDGRSS